MVFSCRSQFCRLSFILTVVFNQRYYYDIFLSEVRNSVTRAHLGIVRHEIAWGRQYYGKKERCGVEWTLKCQPNS